MVAGSLWSQDLLIALVELRHSPEWESAFLDASRNGQKIKLLWNELANTLKPGLGGQEAKDKYNYLLKTFRAHDASARISGNAAPTWRHYYTLKEYFKSDPSVTPTVSIDTSGLNDDSVLQLSEASESLPSVLSPKKSTNQIIKELASEIKGSNASKKKYYKTAAKYQKFKMQQAMKSEAEKNDIESRFEKLEKSTNEIKDMFSEILKKLNEPK